MKWLRFTDQKCELKPDCLVFPISLHTHTVVNMCFELPVAVSLVDRLGYLFCSGAMCYVKWPGQFYPVDLVDYCYRGSRRWNASYWRNVPFLPWRHSLKTRFFLDCHPFFSHTSRVSTFYVILKTMVHHDQHPRGNWLSVELCMTMCCAYYICQVWCINS